MAGPWEKFKKPDSAAAPAGPWTKFQKAGDVPAPGPQAEEPSILDKIKNNLGENMKSVDAFGTGMGNTMTLGYMPQIEAALDTGVDTAKNAITGEDVGNLDDLAKVYQGHKDRVIAHQEQLQNDRPIAYGAGSLGGIFTAPVGLMGKAAAAVPEMALAKTGITKMAPTIARYLKAGSSAAILGGASNPGDEKGQSGDLQLDKRLGNAEFAAPFGIAGQGLSDTVEKSPEMVDKVRRWMAAKQLGTNTTQLKQLMKDLPAEEGVVNPGTRLDRVEQYMDKNGMLNMGTTFSGVQDKSGELADASGKKISSILNGVQQRIIADPNVEAEIAETALHGPNLADDYLTQEGQRLQKVHGGANVLKSLEGEVGTADNPVGLHGLGVDVPLKDLHDYRISVDKQINFARRSGDPKEQSLINLRNFLNDKMQARIGAADQHLGEQNLPQLLSENKNYSNAKTINDISTNTTAREMSKYVPGLIGTLGGGAYGVHEYNSTGDAPRSIAKGMAVGLGLRAARAVAPAVTYRGATALEPYLQKAAQHLKDNPNGAGTFAIPWLNMLQENK